MTRKLQVWIESGKKEIPRMEGATEGTSMMVLERVLLPGEAVRIEIEEEVKPKK